MTDVIRDPRFATLGAKHSPWAILVHQGVRMEPTVKASVLALEISKTKGANWHGELRYSPFAVSSGDMLTVSFAVRARLPFTFSVWLGQQDAPHASLVSPENHFGEKMMAPEWQNLTHTWHALVDEPKARLNFVLGQIDNRVEVKDITLIKK